MRNIFTQSKWIWCGNGDKPEFAVFYKKVYLDKKPKKLTARIACSTRYFFNIANKKGKFAVRNGGMTSKIKNYYDEVDISSYVKKGENAFVFICENVPIENGGPLNASPRFLFEAVNGDQVIAASDSSFSSYGIEYITLIDPEHATMANSYWKYDATSERPLNGLFSVSFASNILTPSKELEAYDGTKEILSPRPIPLYAFSNKPVKAKPVKTTVGNKIFYTVKFDRYRRVYPFFFINNAASMDEILIYGNDPKQHHSYICKMGPHLFDFPFMSVMGDRLTIEAPQNVKISKLQYLTSDYGEPMSASFKCNDPVLNAIFEKSAATLQACIYDRFTSTPFSSYSDLFDLTVGAKDMMIGYGRGGVLLVKKTILDLLCASEKGILMSNPLDNAYEDPFAGLLSCSEFGLFAAYTDCYNDLDDRIFECVQNYLKNWHFEAMGLISSRISDVPVESDNFDKTVCENALFYSALRYARALADRVGGVDTSYLDNSIDTLFNAVDKCLYNGKIYSSGKVCDDRANAFVVLAGLNRNEACDSLAAFLATAQNASAYTECYIIQALTKLGRHKLACMRLKNRYYSVSRALSPAMPESLLLEGEKCSLHSAMPMFTILSCICGVEVKKAGGEVKISVGPNTLDNLTFTAMTPTGKIKGNYLCADGKTLYTVDNDSNANVLMIMHDEKGNVSRNVKLSKGKNKLND